MIYSLNYASDREEYAYVLSISSIVMQLLLPLLVDSCHRVLLEDTKESGIVDGPVGGKWATLIQTLHLSSRISLNRGF